MFVVFLLLFLYRQYETVVPLEDPIITEVTSTLQEWSVLWKQLYVVSTKPPDPLLLHLDSDVGSRSLPVAQK